MPTKHIVGFSGGIDSQAAARYVINRFGPEDTILTNSDAGGNEHPLTTEFVAWYSDTIHPVTYTNAIIADLWKTEGFAETRGFDGSQTLDFGTMIQIKGRPPSRKAQFCTDILKLRPQKRWIEKTFGVGGEFEGWDFKRYTGVRRDESDKRKAQPYRMWDEYFDCPLEAPIMDWTKKMCFEYVTIHDGKYNPLYTLGFGRVGCAPCINSNKDDILNWYLRFPEMIDKIREWEKRSGRTFFAPMVPGLITNDIDQVIEWAKTERGGKVLRVLNDPPACESKYGLCE